MTKTKRRVVMVKIDDDEVEVMKTIRLVVSPLSMPARRATARWFESRYETWPQTDLQGKEVADGKPPPDTDPPILKFLSDHRPSPPEDEAAVADDGEAAG